MKLLLDKIDFFDPIYLSKKHSVNGWFHDFSYEFEFGKSYLLTSLETQQNETLSYLISGLAEPSKGSLLLDERPYTHQQRRQDSWLVRRDEIKRFA